MNVLSKDSWSEEEVKNAELVADFVQHIMNDHDFDYVSKFVKRFPDFTYNVKHIYVDGQCVIFHSHATANKKARNSRY